MANGANRAVCKPALKQSQTAYQLPLEQQVKLLEGQAYECYLTSLIEEAMKAHQAALLIWQQLDIPEQVSHTLRWLSGLSWFLGHSREVEQYAVEAMRLLETFPPDDRLAMAYSNRAQLSMLADNTAEAVRWGELG